MEKPIVKVFKLALPLKCQVENYKMLFEDKYKNTTIVPVNSKMSFDIGAVDSDGFVRFSILSYPEKKPIHRILCMPQSEAHINGYSLFHTNLSNSFGFGGQKSVFEYYKRDSDLAYYALIKKEGKTTRKLRLGSLHEPNSRIFQVARIIHEKFLRGKPFDKGELTFYLPRPLKGARIIKSTLDILNKEGYLTSDTVPSGKRNRAKEVFWKTENLEKFMGDPRSWQKTNGLNIGSLTPTTNP